MGEAKSAMEEVVRRQSRWLKITASSLIVFTAVLVSLFRHWEPSGESWGYWLFSRIFAETGRFVVIDRSPVYVLYLNIFRWLGYPLSVIVEYVVTFSIVLVSMITLFRRYIGLGLATLAAILWIPFLQTAEPHTANLAFGLSCLAIVLRTAKANRFKLAISYSLMGLAYLLRSAYMVFILAFIFWDSINIIRAKKLKTFFAALRPRLSDWPVFVILVLLGWFSFMQSGHPWNNACLEENKWFPGHKKTLADASFIGHCNWRYIYDKYGTFENKDLYFTNQELFKGAETILEAVAANPVFVAKHITRNIKKSFSVIASFTMLPAFLYDEPPAKGRSYYFRLLFIIFPFVLLIFYGSLRAANRDTLLFIVANMLFIAALNIFWVKDRYMQPLIPVFIMSAFWYGRGLNNMVMRFLPGHLERFRVSSGYIIMVIALILFSSGTKEWAWLLKDISSDVKAGEIAIMEARPNSFKASFREINSLVKDCKGVLSLEPKYFCAFLDMPLSNIYSIWEIPPFGHFGDSDYQGLRPDRIDCILISHELATATGFGTNYRLRYQNYIKPYEEFLQRQGADVYKIKKYGRAVILTKYKEYKNVR